MISIAIINENPAERQAIEQSCKREVGLRSDEMLRISSASTREEAEKLLRSSVVFDVIYYELSDCFDISLLARLKAVSPDSDLSLFASRDCSPLLYLRPMIAPRMLVLLPFSVAEFEHSNDELFELIFSRQNRVNAKDLFVLNTRTERTQIPFAKITCFEAASKKILLRTGKEEYDFYDSIDRIETLVPSYFCRTHRAFLVNTREIRSVNFAKGTILFWNDTAGLVSRSYRKSLEAVLSETKPPQLQKTEVS